MITQLNVFSAFPGSSASGKFDQPINPMKAIFSSMDLAAVTRLKDLLESAGIACFIKNDVASYLTGDIAMSGVAPELLIDDDSRLAEALQIKKDWQSPPPAAGVAWTCPKCGEKLEPQFTSCWKCGTAKP